jgi:transposase
MPSLLEERQTAVHLLRAGHTVDAVAEQLGRSPRWVRKWRQRYRITGWRGLQDQSHAAKTHGTRIADSARQAIVQARSELEAEATLGTGLKYIGAPASRRLSVCCARPA